MRQCPDIPKAIQQESHDFTRVWSANKCLEDALPEGLFSPLNWFRLVRSLTWLVAPTPPACIAASLGYVIR